MKQLLQCSSLIAGLRVAVMVLFLACALLLGGSTLSTQSATVQASTEQVMTQAILFSTIVFTQAIPTSFDPYTQGREGVYWRGPHISAGAAVCPVPQRRRMCLLLTTGEEPQ